MSIVQYNTQPSQPCDENYHLSISVDWEFRTDLEAQSNPQTIQEYRRVLGKFKPVLGGYQILASTNRDDVTFSNPSAFVGNVEVVEHPNNRYGLNESWNGETLVTHAFNLKEVEAPVNKKKMPGYIVKFVFFHSALDLLLSFKSLSIQMGIVKQLVQHRTLKVNPENKTPYLKTGVFIEVNGEVKELYLDVKDQSGKGVGSLLKQISALGLKMPYKQVMDDWKDCMDVPYLSLYPSCALGSKDLDGKTYNDRPVNHETGEILHDWHIKYTKGDVIPNFELDYYSHQKMQKVSELLGLNYPVTPFNTVAGVTSTFIVKMIAHSLTEGQTNIFCNEKGLTEIGKNLLGQILFVQSGYLLNEYGGNVNALLTADGAYCKNMTTRRVRIQIGSLVVDIDLKGCYMEGTVVQPYPIGRPLIGVTKYKDEKLTLRQWFAKYEHELVPNCWMLRFSTKTIKEEVRGKKPVYKRYQLNFEQDLFLSKHFDSKVTGDFNDDFLATVLGVIDEYNDKDTSKADFQLNTREITYSILTHDYKQVLDYYAKPSERDEILDNCVVECFWLYPKSQLTVPAKFLERFDIENRPEYKYNHTWCIVPMSDIAQPFIDLRAEEKKLGKIAIALSKKEPISPEDQDLVLKFHGESMDYWRSVSTEVLEGLAVDHDAGQYTFKITGLTIYGSSGSFHYQTRKPQMTRRKKEWVETYNPKHGHFLVANHITARARVAVWSMSKVLNTQVVITDGGMFDINFTRIWDWEGRNRKRVGLHELSRMTNHELTAKELHNNELNIRAVALGGGGEWKIDRIEDNSKTLYVVNDFISLEPFKVAHENLGEIDAIALKQVSEQFSKLDIYAKKQVKFASKDMYGGAAVHSQSNYILAPIEHNGQTYGQEVLKMRGQKINGAVYNHPADRDPSNKFKTHPCAEFLRQLLKDPTNVEPMMEFYTDYQLSVNQFNESPKAFEDYQSRGFLPGSNMSKRSFPRAISLSTFRWQTRHQYEDWKKRDTAMKDTWGYGLEGFFMNDEGSYNYEQAVVFIQNMIDDGADWITAVRTGYEHQVLHPQHKEWALMFPFQESAFIPTPTKINKRLKSPK